MLLIQNTAFVILSLGIVGISLVAAARLRLSMLQKELKPATVVVDQNKR